MLNRCCRITVVLALLSLAFLTWQTFGQKGKPDPLPSWNDGPAKKAILAFVRATTDKVAAAAKQASLHGELIQSTLSVAEETRLKEAYGN